MPNKNTVELEEIVSNECMGNKVEEDVVKEIASKESNLAYKSEDLEERVDIEC